MRAPTSAECNIQLLLAYVADLELEVDRLRKQGQFVQQEVRQTLLHMQLLCGDVVDGTDALKQLPAIKESAQQLALVMKDVQEPSGYHPAHDQVVAISVRPLLEKLFRWQQRIAGATGVSLHLELESAHVDWFPARLRHILDNLLSNAFRYRDPRRETSWVHVRLKALPDSYEFQVSDNGLGIPANVGDQVFQLFHRSAPTRAAGLGVGLAVVKMLVDQSGGTLSVVSGTDQGTTFLLTLPRYEIDDFLT